MHPDFHPKGKLLALEGNGPELRTAARRLMRKCLNGRSAGGVSQWNASNIFYELRETDPSLPRPSPRVLVLLYAADLVFRLRWEIRPALEEGYCVVAAPYVQTAIAFGKATGLPRRWLADLFSFAPKPDACYRIPEQKITAAWMDKPSSGFLEFSCKTLSESTLGWESAEIRGRFHASLDALEHRKGCQTL